MGVYVHIPFCRSKCFYCGFYSVASLRLKGEYLHALGREIALRSGYLQDQNVSTLYFGGGTPSYLEIPELEEVVCRIKNTWTLDAQAECSIEMNPEDAVPEKLIALRKMGFNRLTIGVQSFNDDVLKQINRSHTSRQAVLAVENALKAGFDNVGIDLIIGLPGSDIKQTEADIFMANQLNIDHVSVYILSVDSDSVFEKLSQKGRFSPQDDDVLAEQYLRISDGLKDFGYEHYEISNFARNGKYSRHNTSYWQQKPYVGLGAAAHSFNGYSRQWNVSNIKSYIDCLDKNVLNFEIEELGLKDKYNEYLMTNFRTMWGIDGGYLRSVFPQWWEKTKKQLEQLIENGLIVVDGDRFRMTERGWLLSDGVFSDLFV